MKTQKKIALLFLILFLLSTDLAFSWLYKTRKIECPVCHYINDCCNSRCSVDLSYYRQYWHSPFLHEMSDQCYIYHCQNCRFSILEVDFYPPEPPRPAEDIQYMKHVVDSFDFSHLKEKYKDDDLPRLYVNEIMLKLYSKGIQPTEWREELLGFDDMTFVKFNFIIGYEYQKLQCYDEAREAFQQALFELNRSRDKMRKPQPLDYEYYLYLGSINYFLGHPIEAIRDYERGMKMVDRSTKTFMDNNSSELYFLNCFYHNSTEVLGPFWENPIQFIFEIRNIAFMRAFHIPFDSTLLAILVWFLLAGCWVAASILEKRLNKWPRKILFWLFTLPISLIVAGMATYRLDVQHSLRSMLLVTGIWMILYLAWKRVLQRKFADYGSTHILLSKKYSRLFAGSLFAPWFLFFYASDDFMYELFRLFMFNNNDWHSHLEWMGFTLISLLLWLFLAIGVFLIHSVLSFFFKQEKPGRRYFILSIVFTTSLFLIPVKLMIISRSSHRIDFTFLLLGTSWYVLFLLLETYVAKPLASRFKAFNRLRYAYESSHWKFIRLLFLIYPAAFHIYPNKDYFLKHMLYLLFWPAILGLIFLFHYLMAKTFKDSRNKIGYSISLTLFSTVAIYASMELADVSEYLWINTPGFYLLGGILSFTFIRQYKAYAKRLQDQGKSLPSLYAYLSYNHLWYIIEGSFIVLPLLYAIIWSNRAGYALVELQNGH